MDQGADALVGEKPPDEGQRPARLAARAQGASTSVSTPEPGIGDDAFGGDPEREHVVAIVRILHQQSGAAG